MTTETKERLCPRDGTPLDDRVYEEDIEVDSCATCRGMWLDAGELEAIERADEHDWSKELDGVEDDATAAARVSAELAAAPIACPLCGTTMAAREYAYCSQVVVDTCPAGCGVWLDAGEIQRIENFFAKARKSEDDPGANLWASLRSLFTPGAKKKAKS